MLLDYKAGIYSLSLNVLLFVVISLSMPDDCSMLYSCAVLQLHCVDKMFVILFKDEMLPMA